MTHRRAAPRPRRSLGLSRGFTIIEVVVALTIMSLILLATVSAMRTFGNTQNSLDRMTGRIDELRTVSSFLRDTLQGAVVSTRVSGRDSSGLSLGPRGGSESSAYFRGDVDSFSWKAPVLFGEGYGGTLLVRVVRLDNELTLQWQDPPASLLDIDWSDAQERALLGAIEEFEVSYREDAGDEWLEELGRDGSPALVRLIIKANGRYWPELVMQVPR